MSTLEVLFAGNITSVLTPLAAASLLAFSLLYTPCVAAIASVKRELGGRWAAFVVLWQCTIAWIVAWIVHLIAWNMVEKTIPSQLCLTVSGISHFKRRSAGSCDPASMKKKKFYYK